MAVTGAGENIYIANSNGANYFMRYNTLTNTWEDLPTSERFKNGSYLEWDKGNYIYAIFGGSYSDCRSNPRYYFRRYDISSNSWENLSNTPHWQGPGGTLTWVEIGANEYIYALLGSSSRSASPGGYYEGDYYPEGVQFWRYNIANDEWDENLAPNPYGADDGADLVWTGGDYIYAFVGAYEEELPKEEERYLLRYSISENSWVELEKTPYNASGGVDDGGSLVYPGYGDYIYALKGGDDPSGGGMPGDNFWRYSISNDDWENLPSIPAGVGNQNGHRLGLAGGNIYCWRGSFNDGTLWMYELGGAPPTSSVNTISPHWQTPVPFLITATASDPDGYVENATLWYNWSSDNSSWQGWVEFGVDSDDSDGWSWSFDASNGDEYYKFYTIAWDNDGNQETAPATADAWFGVDRVAPASSVNAISPYWQSSTFQVTATASDATSGVENVSLYYQYSTDNSSWSAWTLYGTDTAAPWAWSFTASSGNVYYEFYSMARDKATNTESAPTEADARCGVDIIVPAAPIGLSASPSSWTSTDSFSVSWTNPPDSFGIAGAYYKLDSVPTSENDGTYTAGSDITSISNITVSGDGSHPVYVWLKNQAGNVDHTNRSSATFNLDTSAPSVPSLLSPPDNAATNDSTPAFDWFAVRDPSGVTYRIQVDASPADWASFTINISGLTSSSYTPTTGLADGSYEWRVLAVDGAGNASDWSSTRLLTVSQLSSTLTIDLVNFTIQPENSITLTAVLTSNDTPLAGKLITWATTTGSVSPENGTTDAQGKVSATYTAPGIETTVTVTASFAGDDNYLGSSWNSSGTIKTASLKLTLAVTFIPAGENHVFKFEDYPVPIFKVTITADDNVENVGVTVEVLENVEVPAPPGVVHSYANITTNIVHANIRGLLTRFRVSKSWVVQNEIDEGTIRVLKFDEVENEWQELSTSFVDEDSTYLYFETSVEGFSLFAITGGKAAPVPILLIVLAVVAASAGGAGAALWVRSRHRPSRLERARRTPKRRKKGKRQGA